MQQSCSAARLLPTAGPLHHIQNACSRSRPLTPCTGPVFRIRHFKTTTSTTSPPSPSPSPSPSPAPSSSPSSAPSSSSSPPATEPSQRTKPSLSQWSPPVPLPIRRVYQDTRWPDRIVPGNLDATLDAHRNANRDALVRRFPAPPRLFRYTNKALVIEEEKVKEQEQKQDQDQERKKEKEEQKDEVVGSSATRETAAATSTLDALIARLSNKSILGDDDVELVASELSRHRGHVVPRPKQQRYSSNVELQAPWGPIIASDMSRLNPKTFRPWTSRTSLDVTSRKRRIEQELEAFTNWMRPTQYESELAADTQAYVTSQLKRRLKQMSLHPHGSRFTGLADATSDLDICMTHTLFDSSSGDGPKLALTHPKAKTLGSIALHRIHRLFSQDPRMLVRQLVYAKVPLIEMLDNKTGLVVQITANTPFRAVRDTTKYYMRRFPQALSIFMVIRHALRMRGLASVHTGGIGSYPLFMMVVAALNRMPSLSDSSADAFKHVLDFWARADLRSDGFTVDPIVQFSKWNHGEINQYLEKNPDDAFLQGCLYMVHQNQHRLLGHTRHVHTVDAGDPFPDYPRWHEGLLMLQDPANPVNDLGFKTYRIDEVMNTWRHLAGKYVAHLNWWRSLPETHRERHGGCLLDPFVLGDYSQLTSRRKSFDNDDTFDPSFDSPLVQGFFLIRLGFVDYIWRSIPSGARRTPRSKPQPHILKYSKDEEDYYLQRASDSTSFHAFNALSNEELLTIAPEILEMISDIPSEVKIEFPRQRAYKRPTELRFGRFPSDA